MTKKHFRLEVCCRIVEVHSKPGRPAMGGDSLIAKQEELTRTFLVSKHATKEAAQAALLGTAVGAAFGPALQEG